MKVLSFLLILYHLAKAQETLDELTSVATRVRKHYSSPSVIIVYDRKRFDFQRDKILLQVIKAYSKKHSMSQAISYELLDEAWQRRENALYVFVIFERKSLEHAINATRNIDMSTHPWLIFVMSNDTSVFNCDEPDRDEFFKLKMDTKMMAKCRGNKVLKRYYSIFENLTEVMDLAEWTSEKKLEFKDSNSLKEVETNFKGITLTIATKSSTYNITNSKVTGYLKFLMKELKSLGNFQTEITYKTDATGYFDNKTQKWSGMMKAMVEKRADIGMILFSLSPVRLQVVDFATPIIRAQYRLYAKLPDTQQVSWTAYLKAFNKNSWIAYGISIIIFSLTLCILENKFRRFSIHSFFDTFVKVWGIYNQQGSSENSSITSIRILYFFILVVSLLLYTIYSAAIASYITSLKVSLPFTTYDEFKRDTSYKLVVLTTSKDRTHIAGNDSILTPLRSHLKKDCHLPADPIEAFQQTCNEKVAFYTSDVVYRGLTNAPSCKISWVQLDRVEHLSFTLTKNSPYTKSISYLLLRLKENGVVKKLETQEFFNYTEINKPQTSRISFEEILPILVIFLVGVTAASFVYIIEVITYHISNLLRPVEMNMHFRGRNNQPVIKKRRNVRLERQSRF